jgi:hypothetical protein
MSGNGLNRSGRFRGSGVVKYLAKTAPKSLKSQWRQAHQKEPNTYHCDKVPPPEAINLKQRK